MNPTLVIPHDHLIECPECGMPTADIRDCQCRSESHHGYKLCRFCRETRNYERYEEAV